MYAAAVLRLAISPVREALSFPLTDIISPSGMMIMARNRGERETGSSFGVDYLPLRPADCGLESERAFLSPSNTTRFP